MRSRVTRIGLDLADRYRLYAHAIFLDAEMRRVAPRISFVSRRCSPANISRHAHCLVSEASHCFESLICARHCRADAGLAGRVHREFFGAARVKGATTGVFPKIAAMATVLAKLEVRFDPRAWAR